MTNKQDKIDLRSYDNRYETNPFMVELQGKMFLQPRANTIIAKGQSIVDTSTGEIIKDETVLIGKRKIVDKSNFAKIYASEIGTLYSLSKPAQNVFLYLSSVMDYDNKSYINTEKDCIKIGYKTGLSVTKGLKELINRHLIAPSVMIGWYWMNPTVICKGERFAKYTEYVVGSENEIIKAENQLKQQHKQKFDLLPEQVYNKLEKASQTQLDFEDNNPYNLK